MRRNTRAITLLILSLTPFGLDTACRDFGRQSAGPSESGAGPSASAGDGAVPQSGEGGVTDSGDGQGSAANSGDGQGSAANSGDGQGGAGGELNDAGTLDASDSGAAGDTNGAGGEAAIDGGNEDVLVPGCVENDPYTAWFTIPHALATSTTASLGPYQIYTTEPQDNMLSTRWKTGPDDGAAWTTWQCFSFVPRPEQVSAINISDSAPFATPEVYATTADGQIYVRRFFGDVVWGPWQSLGLPQSNSNVIDVAASSTPSTLAFIYALDAGKVFIRHHVSILATSSYTQWTEMNGIPDGVTHLCAGARPDSRQELFVATSAGAVFAAVQQSFEPDDGFGSFQLIGDATAPAMIDVDCGYLPDNTVAVFGLSAAGAVWSHSSNAPASSNWLPEAMGSLTVKILSVGSGAGAIPTLLGFDEMNQLWWHAMGSSIWNLID